MMELNTRRRRDRWSSLPYELLTMIGDRLETRIDVLRFRAVCTSWRSSIPLSHRSSPLFPMKLPFRIDPVSTLYVALDREHINLTESTLYRFEPLDRDKGSNYSRAWLVKVEEFKPGKFRLLNPLSYHPIRYEPEMYPKKLNLLDYRVFELSKAYKIEYVDKAIFSAEHSSVFVLYKRGLLALFRLRDKKWTQMSMREPGIDYYSDIMLYMGEFHAIDMWGKLVVINSSTLKMTKVSQPLYYTGSKKHLLQSSGEIYLVDHQDNRRTGKTVDFEIYKLNGEERDWVKVKSLADQVMFLCDDCSFFSSAEELAGCRGNCIYFTDEKSIYYHSGKDDVLRGLHGHNTALFNLEDRSISRLATGPGNFQVIWPPPIWFKSN